MDTKAGQTAVEDTLSGGGGNDILIGEDSDKFDGGDGTDTVRFDAPVSAINLADADLVNVEIVEITAGTGVSLDLSVQVEDLVIRGNNGPDTITGGKGDDTITAGRGGDVIELSAGGDDRLIWTSDEDSGYSLIGNVITANNVDTVRNFDFAGEWKSGQALGDWKLGDEYINGDLIELRYRSDDMLVSKLVGVQGVAAANEFDALRALSNLTGLDVINGNNNYLRENYTDAVFVEVSSTSGDKSFEGYYLIINSDLNAGFDADNDTVIRFTWDTAESAVFNLTAATKGSFFYNPDPSAVSAAEPNGYVAPAGGVTVDTATGAISPVIANSVTNVANLDRSVIFGRASVDDRLDASSEVASSNIVFDFQSGVLSGAAAVAANSIRYENFDSFKGGAGTTTVSLHGGHENYFGGSGVDTVIIDGISLTGVFDKDQAGAIEVLEARGENNDISRLNSGSDAEIVQLKMVGAQTSVRMTEAQLDALAGAAAIRADGADDEIIVATGDLRTLTVDADIERFVIEDDFGTTTSEGEGTGVNAVKVILSDISTRENYATNKVVTVQSISKTTAVVSRSWWKFEGGVISG